MLHITSTTEMRTANPTEVHSMRNWFGCDHLRADRQYESTLTARDLSHTVWPSKIIRSMAEASEVTRQWRTLNINPTEVHSMRNGFGCDHLRADRQYESTLTARDLYCRSARK